ncbi:MAG: hypothetical protein GWN16_04765, partial [Calditrichae bacterium]|nr:hypothetical protein [Calditrichia bacterium]
MTLFIDGAAGTTMYNLDSLTSNPRRRTQFLHHFPESFPFFFLEENEKDSALIIGPGGGRDVVVALLGNVKSIIAVEVNPDLVEIMREYEDFNGGLYTQLPNVQVVVQEGRNYIRSVNKKFDLIMLALPITKSSRSVEGYALTENYLFTVDAVENYLDHLTPEGRLVIVAHGEAEIYRLLTLTLTAFEKRGIDAPEAMKHIYTLAHGVMPSIVVKRQPFDSLAAERRHELMHTLGYDRGNFFVPFSPQVRLRPLENLGIMAEWTMFDQILFDISKGKLTVDQLINSTPLDLRPVTDDSPFFYNFKPGLPQPFGLFTLLIISLIVILFIPFSTGIGKSSSDHPLLKPFFLHPRLKLFLIIFFLLGVGFMLIEISLLQKLTLYIGQPIMVLSLLLASLLLGTGLGSLCSSAINTKIYRFFAAAVLLISGMVIGFQVSFMEIFSLSLNTKLIAGILTLLLGFLLGFPFPLSIRLMKQFGVERYIHWMYGINGIASVVGSAAAMIIGILWGFSYALYLAAILYGITGLAAFLLPRASSRYRLLSASVEASDHYVTQ